MICGSYLPVSTAAEHKHCGGYQALYFSHCKAIDSTLVGIKLKVSSSNNSIPGFVGPLIDSTFLDCEGYYLMRLWEHLAIVEKI